MLGRDDIGRLAPGMAADFVAWRTDGVSFSGAQHDLVAALLFCTPGLAPVDLSVINGEIIVRDGHILTCDMKVSMQSLDYMTPDQAWSSLAMHASTLVFLDWLLLTCLSSVVKLLLETARS